ncbi:MAG TPA: glucoamylase family protein [Blastocatellia bacterium]|nr:glucoamylase family protein [Blastocatellia bacterium]
MKLSELWRSIWPGKQPTQEPELSDEELSETDDPFAAPVVLEITDTIDLHSIPPRQIKEVVEEYLLQAHAHGFAIVRIIHGKGIGVQREAVRKILSQTEFVTSFYDAPGNLGATIAELASSTVSRREFLGGISGLMLAGAQGKSASHPSTDSAFLEDLSRRLFRYFQEQTDPITGLVLDRARTDGSIHDEAHRNTASIAATGFGLTAWCIAAERGWVNRKETRQLVFNSLTFFAERAHHDHGWFWHWMNWRTGERVWTSEVSSIDTALLLGGILTCRQYFHHDKEIVRLATKIYERVDFPWMLNGHPHLLSHGLREESGFITYRWENYSENAGLYLLAIGSPTHPISPESWRAWKREWVSYGPYKYLSHNAPLFIHQYSHAWVDFRGRREVHSPNVDYFENSVIATRAHRQFCLDLAKEFHGYSKHIWGISASDSAKGYVAWGGPPRHEAIDGSVVPCAAGGSLMFAPELALPALSEMRRKFGDRIYGRYGFADAFHPVNGWVNPDVIGIDVGIMLLSAENLRSKFVWRWFMRNPEIPRAMKLVGLLPVPARKAK